MPRLQLCLLLQPISWIYGLIIAIRNRLFDCGLLHQHQFPIPIICVGNLSVGGTGKTPHTEFLLRLLAASNRVAMLSRGYKRKTKGYVFADTSSSALSIGDEPFQIFRKFPNVQVAVCEKRVVGINNLLSQPKVIRPQLIVLDDAFQHRYVKPGFSIILTDYNRLMSRDSLLPAGRLREPFSSRSRADVIIVSKCPLRLDELEMNLIKKELKPFAHQKVYFSSFNYGKLHSLYGEDELDLDDLDNSTGVLLLTAIAHPESLCDRISATQASIQMMRFPDHHAFTITDEERINKKFGELELKGYNRNFVITTEKDAARLMQCRHLSDRVKKQLMVLPVEVCLLNNQYEDFKTQIEEYVGKNS